MPVRPTTFVAPNLRTRVFFVVLAASLAVSALLFFVFTWRWPLVGDASLIHYIAFLIQRGWAPYRQLGDMNMPGSYLIELAAMHLFGTGDLAWRIFDFTLVAAAATAFVSIFRVAEAPAPAFQVGSGSTPRGWLLNSFPALFSASLFILIHGRDGLAEGGQRDLTMAVCLLTAMACLFHAVRRAASSRPTLLAPAAFGLLSGVALTIKPTAILLTLAQLALALHAARPAAAQPDSPLRSAWRTIALPATLAGLIGPAIALLFLLREHALAAFLAGLHTVVPYYASLGHRPLFFVLLHSVSPLLPIVIAWLAVLMLRRGGPALLRNWERNALLAGVLFGLINCVVQQRALPYYRYPLLVFLLPLVARDLLGASVSETTPTPEVPSVTASPSRAGTLLTQIRRALAFLTLAYASLILAPQSAILIHRYQWWNLDFIQSLSADLNSLGGASASGRVQCIDSISGCGNVLYRLRLEPSTGLLSDFLLFGAVSDRQPPDQIPVIRSTRAQFSAAITAHPPEFIIVTSHLHIDGPDNFEKLARWPAFASFLASRYTLRKEWHPARPARWWSREEIPASYRIYVLNPAPRNAIP